VLGLLRAGDRAAAQPLWEAYCSRLAALARRNLRDASHRAADEEGAAPSACNGFYPRRNAAGSRNSAGMLIAATMRTREGFR
jgi:hypothetical protein